MQRLHLLLLVRGAPPNAATKTFSEENVYLDTHTIPRCGSFHPPFSKNVLLSLFRVSLFSHLLLICILHLPTPHPPRLIVLEKGSATLARRTPSSCIQVNVDLSSLLPYVSNRSHFRTL